MSIIEKPEIVDLHKIVFDNSIRAIDIDTRDFECVLNYDRLQLSFNKEYAQKRPSEYVYTIEEIKNTLLKIEKDSGGKASWRFLTYPEFKHTDIWMKYIFVRKISDNQYVMLIEKFMNKNKSKYLCTLLAKEIWTSKIADEDILNTH